MAQPLAVHSALARAHPGRLIATSISTSGAFSADSVHMQSHTEVWTYTHNLSIFRIMLNAGTDKIPY